MEVRSLVRSFACFFHTRHTRCGWERWIDRSRSFVSTTGENKKGEKKNREKKR